MKVKVSKALKQNLKKEGNVQKLRLICNKRIKGLHD